MVVLQILRDQISSDRHEASPEQISRWAARALMWTI
jgi:hypothetical protein